MSSNRDTTRIVRLWLEEGATALPDRVLDTVLDQVPATHQRRAGWPAWRFPQMNNTVRFALAAAVVVVVAFLGIRFLVPDNTGGPGPTSTPSATSAASAIQLPSVGNLQAGTYVIGSTTSGGWLACPEPPTPGCSDSIRILFTVPDGWVGGEGGIGMADGGNSAPGGAGMLIFRGSGLASDPCAEAGADIPVGPTVDDFASAIADHPLLDTTTPIDVTLGGYSGKYLDLQTPADLAGCPYYRPWDPGIYAQGPSQRWHLWILDVDGSRVVVETFDYPGTSAQHQAELQAIVDSIQIEP